MDQGQHPVILDLALAPTLAHDMAHYPGSGPGPDPNPN